MMTQMNGRQKERLWELFACIEDKRLKQTAQSFKGSEAYLNLSTRQRTLFDQLQDALPEALHPVLKEYTEACNEISAAQEQYFYKTGFEDGISLAKMLIDWGQMLHLIEDYINGFGSENLSNLYKC